MKNSLFKTGIRVITTLFIFCVFVLTQISINFLVSAQTACNDPTGLSIPRPDPSGSLSRWAQNASVQVHVSSNPGQFSRTEFDNCIKPAFNDFNTANLPTTVGGNSSGVTFSVAFSSDEIAEIATTTGRAINAPGISTGFQVNKGNPDPSEGNPNQKTGGITYPGFDTSSRNSAVTIMNSQITNYTALRHQVAHEIGHTMGLDDICTSGSPCFSIGATVMDNRPPKINPDGSVSGTESDLNDNTYGRNNPSDCDNEVIKCQVYQIAPCPTPTPTPEPPPVGYVAGTTQTCQYPQNNFTQGACPYGYTADTTGYYCCRTGCPVPETDEDCVMMKNDCIANGGNWKGCCRGCFSPIVIDVAGNGFNLTDGNNGVDLDLTGEGVKERTAWTAANSDDAWLVLDRNNNQTVDNALELFGNFTEQPETIPVKDRNGFSALAVFDKADKGGNGDGKINKQDTIYNQLRLWQDSNHNGISELNELKTLDALDVRAIFLDYKISKKKDEYGNRFVYRARVRDRRDADVGKWAWDVFLVKPK